MNSSDKYSVISLFSGALGLDLGLERAGFTPKVYVELDEKAVDTIRKNKPGIPVIAKDINFVSTAEILKIAELEVGDVTLVAGGPPCQAFSTAGRRMSFNDPRGALISQFIRVLREARPKYFLMENVRGILSAAIKHRPLKERGGSFPPLSDEEQPGSVFNLILKDFRDLGYNVSYRLVNSADYGVPQKRERVIIIGSRVSSPFVFPEPTHARIPENNQCKWRTLGDALGGLMDPCPEYVPYSEERLSYLRLIPPGGNWRSLPEDIRPIAMGGAYKSGGGKVGFYRRLDFDKPSPTVTTSPFQKATDMCHPAEDRPLSVKEYARIQEFPDDWFFAGNLSDKYRLIGNAVPVGLGYAIGKALKYHIDNYDSIRLEDTAVSI